MRRDYPFPLLLFKAMRAALALARARFELQTISPNDIITRNRAIVTSLAGRDAPGSAASGRTVDETAFFINRMATRVPWRSDCLVQALAGQRWLASAGIASEIVIGIAKRADGSFESHAWLRQDGTPILGGDISTYQPLLDPEAIAPNNL